MRVKTSPTTWQDHGPSSARGSLPAGTLTLDPRPIEHTDPPALCAVFTCDRMTERGRWCLTHYFRAYRGADMTAPIRPRAG